MPCGHSVYRSRTIGANEDCKRRKRQKIDEFVEHLRLKMNRVIYGKARVVYVKESGVM